MRGWPWLFPLAIASAVAALSHQPAYPWGLTLPLGLDKAAHAVVFTALAFSLDFAVLRTRGDWPLYRRHLTVFAVAACFGMLDEWHQSFIPGRLASLGDGLADAAGAALGLAAASLPWLRSRHLARFSWQKGAPRRRDPSRPLILVADPHWDDVLVGLEAATKSHPEADWLFLGDVFDLWIGLPGMGTPAQVRLLAWVDARRAAGAWVGLWLGNREFFLDRHASRFDLMGEGTGGELPDEGLAFEHGDLVNAADRNYRLWNQVSRGGFFFLLGLALTPRGAHAFAGWLAGKFRTVNPEYKLAFPREAFAAAAAEWPGRVFVTGHFHTQEIVGNGTALPWAHAGEFMLWQGGRVGRLPSPGSTLEAGAGPSS
jgi:UDP-2,3-diacylglucosamine pyrophosphatase LpxH